MRRIGFLFLVFLMFSCKQENSESIVSKPLEVSDNELINYIEYCNSRFEICFDYPSNFSAQPEPVNGDGRTFLNKIDESEIVLYGFHDQGNEGLESQLDILNEVMEIDSIVEIENGYDVRGVDREDGRIHFERLMIKPDIESGTYEDGTPVNIIYSLQFLYPKEKQEKFKGYWEEMNAKFR